MFMTEQSEKYQNMAFRKNWVGKEHGAWKLHMGRSQLLKKLCYGIPLRQM